MNKDLKIALAVIAGALLVCALPTLAVFLFAPRALQGVFVTRAPDASRVGHEIVEYVLPPGYRETYATSDIFYKAVYIGPEAGSGAGMTLMLFQYSRVASAGSDPFGEFFSGGTFEDVEEEDETGMQVVGTRTVTIRGRAVTLTTYESGPEQSGAARQVIGSFPGKGGTVMLIVAGDPNNWDQALLDNFIASIR